MTIIVYAPQHTIQFAVIHESDTHYTAVNGYTFGSPTPIQILKSLCVPDESVAFPAMRYEGPDLFNYDFTVTEKSK